MPIDFVSDDIWFASRPLDVPFAEVVRAFARVPHRDIAGAFGRVPGLDIRTVHVVPGALGRVAVLARLDDHHRRRRRAVELRIEPWTHEESRVRIAPARRSLRRRLPGRRFYESGDAVLRLLARSIVPELVATGAPHAAPRAA